jgi:short-subunit dehydrogenase
MQKNLFHPGAAEELYDEVNQMGIVVNVLVNDAGQGEWGAFIETALERDINIIQLNIISLLTLTKLYLKDMVLRDEGKILQLGSEAGTAPIPLQAVYSASKAFVLSFTAALFNELKELASPAEVAKDGYKALMNGESKIISGSKTKMHVFMNELFGAKQNAANNRTLMEPANKENGRELPSHSESLKEKRRNK